MIIEKLSFPSIYFGGFFLHLARTFFSRWRVMRLRSMYKWGSIIALSAPAPASCKVTQHL